MSKQLTRKGGLGIFAALVLAGALAIYLFSVAQPVFAQSTVDREFSVNRVDPGAALDVTVTHTAQDISSVDVTETLPPGWTFGSIVDPSELDFTQNGQDITFKVATIKAVKYRVTAPSTPDEYTFSGTFDGASVTGDSTVTVGAGGTDTGGTDTGGTDTGAPDSAPPAVKLSSKTAGASVQVTINSTAYTTITSATDITVNLKKFGVPSAISESSVNINDTDKQGDGDDRGYSGEPNSVTVDGTKITLALYSRFPGQELDAETSPASTPSPSSSLRASPTRLRQPGVPQS